MPAARRAASTASMAASGRSTITATSVALRKCAAIAPPSLSQSNSERAAGLPTPKATNRSSGDPSGAITSTEAAIFDENPVIENARSSVPEGSQDFAASLNPPFSAANRTALPFFGVWILAKLMDGCGVICCPVVSGIFGIVADIWRFCRFLQGIGRFVAADTAWKDLLTSTICASLSNQGDIQHAPDVNASPIPFARAGW